MVCHCTTSGWSVVRFYAAAAAALYEAKLRGRNRLATAADFQSPVLFRVRMASRRSRLAVGQSVFMS